MQLESCFQGSILFNASDFDQLVFGSRREKALVYLQDASQCLLMVSVFQFSLALHKFFIGFALF